MKKLRLSQNNKKLSGVFGGLGDYFDVDPIILRLVFIFLCLFNPILVLFYPLAALIIPDDTRASREVDEFKDDD